jgi:hypothetical protein
MIFFSGELLNNLAYHDLEILNIEWDSINVLSNISGPLKKISLSLLLNSKTTIL